MFSNAIFLATLVISLQFSDNIISFFVKDAYAKNPITNKYKAEDKVMVLNCPITPGIWGISNKPLIYLGNNLWRKVGSAEFAKGQYIELIGRVTDNSCVPISQAVVEIWQLDYNGYDNNHYGYGASSGMQTLKNKVNKSITSDLNFVGSGSTTTDNLGYYRFYTVIPGKYKQNNKPPHIKFYVHHMNFIGLEGEMFFEDLISQKEIDSVISKIGYPSYYKELILAKKIAVNKIVAPDISVSVYNFNITMEGKNRYKEY